MPTPDLPLPRQRQGRIGRIKALFPELPYEISAVCEFPEMGAMRPIRPGGMAAAAGDPVPTHIRPTWPVALSY